MNSKGEKWLLEQLILVGDQVAARHELDRLLAEPQPSAEVHLKGAYVLRMEGRGAEALAAIDEALALKRSFPRALLLLLRGMLRVDAGQLDEAAVDFETVTKAEPKNHEAHYKLAQVCRSLGRESEAQKHL
ncbi:MAG: tetratricopeptide repeat protein [Planctomycetaceae bacterium]|nr:tetratricopeptide repeat protein [Planctomycetaceae bacterium]